MDIISEDGLFEWDSEKDLMNLKKHGITFNDILEVFEDPFRLVKYDSIHSTVEEERYFSLGSIRGIVIIAVCHTDRDGRIRIISARKAEPRLRKVYIDYVRKNHR